MAVNSNHNNNRNDNKNDSDTDSESDLDIDLNIDLNINGRSNNNNNNNRDKQKLTEWNSDDEIFSKMIDEKAKEMGQYMRIGIKSAGKTRQWNNNFKVWNWQLKNKKALLSLYVCCLILQLLCYTMNFLACLLLVLTEMMTDKHKDICQKH